MVWEAHQTAGTVVVGLTEEIYDKFSYAEKVKRCRTQMAARDKMALDIVLSVVSGIAQVFSGFLGTVADGAIRASVKSASANAGRSAFDMSVITWKAIYDFHKISTQ